MATPIIDYDSEGTATYREDFWEGRGRAYEDRVERIALERLLKPGRRMLELGAGFGRLSECYADYEQVILLDYSISQLAEARQRLGDERYLYVAANIYQLPIADGACDAASMIRVLHHFADVPAALMQIRQALSPGALFILEFANKRNLKAILRYALRQQDWNPFKEEPIEFVKLNFDFHPRYIKDALANADFATQRMLAVSYFRLGVLKRVIPVGLLAGADALLQPSGLHYSPSIFTQNSTPGERPAKLPQDVLKCPLCGGTAFAESDTQLDCQGCGATWAIENGIYDFREPK